jgi:hypothetical protein
MVAMPAAIVAAPFWAVAGLTRHLPRAIRLEPSNTKSWEELLQFVPEVGWQSRPNLDVHAYADDTFHLTTDAEGWRGSGSLDDAEVVVFGDSYAFGHGVDDADLYTTHTGGVKVKALGSDGYSMVHAVLWMERLASRLQGKTVVWMVYPGNDFYDNLKPNYGRYRMPFVRQRDGRWEIHTDHVSEDPWPLAEDAPSYLTELARVCTPGFEGDRAAGAATYLIDRADHVCRDSEAELIILSVPRRAQIDPRLLPDLCSRSPVPEHFDPRRPDLALAAHCRQSEIRFLALAEHLSAEDYQVRDIHWKASGHVKVGKLIADLYLKGARCGSASTAGTSPLA